jgi:hypothetical protein
MGKILVTAVLLSTVGGKAVLACVPGVPPWHSSWAAQERPQPPASKARKAPNDRLARQQPLAVHDLPAIRVQHLP